MEFKKSQAAGLLFGAAMGILFCVMMGTPGLTMLAPFTILGMQMFKHLDEPKKTDKDDATRKK